MRITVHAYVPTSNIDDGHILQCNCFLYAVWNGFKRISKNLTIRSLKLVYNWFRVEYYINRILFSVYVTTIIIVITYKRHESKHRETVTDTTKRKKQIIIRLIFPTNPKNRVKKSKQSISQRSAVCRYMLATRLVRACEVVRKTEKIT